MYIWFYVISLVIQYDAKWSFGKYVSEMTPFLCL